MIRFCGWQSFGLGRVVGLKKKKGVTLTEPCSTTCELTEVVFFGLQYFMKRYLMGQAAGKMQDFR